MNRLFTMLWLMRILSAVSVWLLASAWQESSVFAQSSSLFRRVDANPAPLVNQPAEDTPQGLTQASFSYFAVRPLPKRVFKVNDLITVIVRHSSTYKHDGETDNKREVKYNAALADWIRFKDCKHLVPDTMPAGDPKINFAMQRQFKGDGSVERTDEVTTRITCKIIDVLPNGSLQMEGGPIEIETGTEKQVITLSGICRSEDIMADNTVLSSQIANLKFSNKPSGSVADTQKRGWITRAWDFLRPF